jgi:hypothetical protein
MIQDEKWRERLLMHEAFSASDIAAMCQLMPK